jgi:hypothetical protein
LPSIKPVSLIDVFDVLGVFRGGRGAECADVDEAAEEEEGGQFHVRKLLI